MGRTGQRLPGFCLNKIWPNVWALSHTVVQCQDTLVLLYVAKPSKQGTRACEPVSSLKNMCKQKRPEVEVEVAVVEGKEKGPTIVEAAKRQVLALLVLGQKKSITWSLIMMWASNRIAVGAVESVSKMLPARLLQSEGKVKKPWWLFDHY